MLGAASAQSLVSALTSKAKPKRVCPYTTKQIIDVCIEFIVAYTKFYGSKIHVYGYQRRFMRRIIRSLLLHDGCTITGLWSRQSGKSEALATMAPGLGAILPTLALEFPDDQRFSQYSSGFAVGVFAPTLPKATIIFSRIKARAETRHAQALHIELGLQPSLTTSRGDKMAWSNGSFVVTRSFSETTNAEGETYHLVIIDEAQLLTQWKLEKEIAPMMSSTFGTTVMIGTPNPNRGPFHKAILHNTENERKEAEQFANGDRAKGARTTHFEFPWEAVCAEKQRAFEETGETVHTLYALSVKSDLQKLYGGNAEAPAFRLNYRLLWQDANLGAIDRRSLDNSKCDGLAGWNGKVNYCREVQEPRQWCRQVAGIDVGKKRDMTVVTVMEIDPVAVYTMTELMRPGSEPLEAHTKTIIAWYEIPGRSWREINKGIIRALAGHNCDTIVIDGTGVGDPVSEMLQLQAPDLNVVPYIMSAKGNDNAAKLYAQELDSGRLLYCAGPETQSTREYQEFIRQHELAEYKTTQHFISYCAPEGDHDDYLDSAMLANIAALMPEPNNAENTTNPAYEQQEVYRSREERYTTGRRR